MGAVYALIGMAYNTMFAASRVMSFTTGQVGMIGGVLGSLIVVELGLPVALGFLLMLIGCAVVGVLTERLAVRPVLKKLEQHLYVLSTLAMAMGMQQLVAILWGTEPRPFPRLLNTPAMGVFDERFWLPLLACMVVVAGLEYLYRSTLIGRAFLAVAEDSFAARALGLPERRLRVASYALAGMIAGVAGFFGGELMLAYFGNGATLSFYGFIPIALGGLGNNRGALVGGFALGLFQQAANFALGGVIASCAVFAVFIIILLVAPGGLFGSMGGRRV